jgi:hypothetical protein
VREVIVCADDKRIESVLRIELNLTMPIAPFDRFSLWLGFGFLHHVGNSRVAGGARLELHFQRTTRGKDRVVAY